MTDDVRTDGGSLEPQPNRRRSRLWLIVAAGAVAVAVVGTGIALLVPAPEVDSSAQTADPTTPPPEPLTFAAPTPAPLGDPESATSAVTAAAETLVAASNEVLQRGDGGIEGIESVATGFVEGEMRALAAERIQLGYKQVGTATVTSVTVQSIDLEGEPPTALLGVCVDTSDIDVVDSNGKSVGDQLYRPGHPVLHLYGAVFTDGLWKLSTHEIPDGATCA